MRLRAAAVLAAALLAIVAAGCGGGEETTATPDTVEGTVPADTTATETTGGGETAGGETTETTGGGTGEGNAEAGADVFQEAGCGGCHTLSAAGSSGTVGPNLDDAKPSADLVMERVTNGKGAMPSFKDQLSEQQIKDVAAYVSQNAGS
jgi:mono/diheme cytochrome c family protein